jgi:hypothetical protein
MEQADSYVPHFCAWRLDRLTDASVPTETWCVGVRSTKHEAVHFKDTKFCFRPSTGQVKIAVPRLNLRVVTSNRYRVSEYWDI